MVGPDTPRIITPDQRPRVFPSSTLQELADERAAARAAIEALRLIPGLDWAAAYTHNGIGQLLAVRGDIDGAIGEFTRFQELGHQAGNVGAEMQSLVFEANLHLMSGRRDRARELLESACDLVELQPFYEGTRTALKRWQPM